MHFIGLCQIDQILQYVSGHYTYEKPEVIMGKIDGLEDHIKANVVELKIMLKQP
jgi:hypothetical protein